MTDEISRRGLFTIAGAALGAGLGGAWLASGTARAEGHRLRPPGAMEEPDFLAACIRCGQCVQVCPYDTLKLAGLEAGLECGTPQLDTRAIPCELCAGHDSLLCIDACPTGALGAVEDLRDIRMGVAVIDRDLCLSWQNTACRACWHACPYPNEAIVLDWKTRPSVVAEACIGCGLCDRACLTEPSSVRIVPRADFRDGDPTHVGEGSAPF